MSKENEEVTYERNRHPIQNRRSRQVEFEWADEKKGADRGIDGRRYFHDEARGGKSIDYPQTTDVTFKKAQRVRSNPSEQKTLPMEGEPPEK